MSTSPVLDFVQRFLSRDAREVLRLFQTEPGGYLGVINRAVVEWSHNLRRWWCPNGHGWISRSRKQALQDGVICHECGATMRLP